MDQPGFFTISGFRIDRITRFHVLARAALRNPGRAVAAVGYVARHGVAAAKLRMAERLNAPSHDGYKDWIALFDTLAADDIAAINAHIAAMKVPPLISVVMPVYDPDPGHLARRHGLGAGAALSPLGTLHRRRRLDRSARSGVCSAATRRAIRASGS